MEGGALSEKTFPAFSSKVVPFLHITTRIEGKKYDTLLQEKGFRGFPSLAFMDAEGNVLHKQGDRSVQAFETSLAAIPALADLEKRVAAGEKGLEYDLLMARWGLGKIAYAEIKKTADGLTGLTKEQKAKLSVVLIDAEIDQLGMSIRVRNQEQREAALRRAAPRFKEIVASGHSMSERRGQTVWGGLMSYAELVNDVELFAKGVAYYKKELADEPRAARYLKSLDEALAEMRKAADKR